MKKKIELSSLMKSAWRAYKYSRRGRSFGEILKAQWMLAKVQNIFDVMDEKRNADVLEWQRTKAEREAKEAQRLAKKKAESEAEAQREQRAAARLGMTWAEYSDSLMMAGTRLYTTE